LLILSTRNCVFSAPSLAFHTIFCRTSELGFCWLIANWCRFSLNCNVSGFLMVLENSLVAVDISGKVLEFWGSDRVGTVYFVICNICSVLYGACPHFAGPSWLTVDSPGFSRFLQSLGCFLCKILRTWKVLKNDCDPRKSWKFKLYVLEFAELRTRNYWRPHTSSFRDSLLQWQNIFLRYMWQWWTLQYGCFCHTLICRVSNCCLSLYLHTAGYYDKFLYDTFGVLESPLIYFGQDSANPGWLWMWFQYCEHVTSCRATCR